MNERGAIVTVHKPTQKELVRHTVVMAASTFHEVQHIATDILLNPDLNIEEMDDTYPAPGPAKEKRTTPEHIGRSKCAGRVIGDSGFALEEKIFGCRLMHREKRRFPEFMVRFCVDEFSLEYGL